jgi:hypothetical protein
MRAVVMGSHDIDQIGGHKIIASQKIPASIGRGDLDRLGPSSGVYFSTMAVNG